MPLFSPPFPITQTEYDAIRADEISIIQMIDKLDTRISVLETDLRNHENSVYNSPERIAVIQAKVDALVDLVKWLFAAIGLALIGGAGHLINGFRLGRKTRSPNIRGS